MTKCMDDLVSQLYICSKPELVCMNSVPLGYYLSQLEAVMFDILVPIVDGHS